MKYSKTLLLLFNVLFYFSVFAQSDTLLLHEMEGIGYFAVSEIKNDAKINPKIDSVLLQHDLHMTSNFNIEILGKTINVTEAHTNKNKTGISANYSTLIINNSGEIEVLETYNGYRGIVSKDDSAYLIISEINSPFRDIRCCCYVSNLTLYNLSSKYLITLNGPYFYE